MPWASIYGQGTTDEPVRVELTGPGPFRLPKITGALRIEDCGEGSAVLHLETERGQMVSLPVSARTLVELGNLLKG